MSNIREREREREREKNPNWWHEKARAGELLDEQIKVLMQKQIERKRAERERRIRASPLPSPTTSSQSIPNVSQEEIDRRKKKHTENMRRIQPT